MDYKEEVLKKIATAKIVKKSFNNSFIDPMYFPDLNLFYIKSNKKILSELKKTEEEAWFEAYINMHNEE